MWRCSYPSPFLSFAAARDRWAAYAGAARLKAANLPSPARSLLRADRYAAGCLLAGGEGGDAGAVQVGLVDCAGVVDSVGPVEVAAVYRHPGRFVPGHDGVRAGAVQAGLIDLPPPWPKWLAQ